MLQKNPLLVFSRPLTYFGSSQPFQDEVDDVDTQYDLMRLGLETDLLSPFQQSIGLFLHWSDIE